MLGENVWLLHHTLGPPSVCSVNTGVLLSLPMHKNKPNYWRRGVFNCLCLLSGSMISNILVFILPNVLYSSLKAVGHLLSINNCRSAWLCPSPPAPGYISYHPENCLLQVQSSSLSESPPFKPIKLFLLTSPATLLGLSKT